MPQIQLTPAQRKVHRAEAHHLDPVVMVGNDGLTPAVVKETDAALKAHGLIKIRVLGDDRVAREAMFNQLAEDLCAAPIQHIGKLLVLWRPVPEKEKTVSEDRMAGPRDFKVLKYSSRGGQRPGPDLASARAQRLSDLGSEPDAAAGPQRGQCRDRCKGADFPCRRARGA